MIKSAMHKRGFTVLLLACDDSDEAVNVEAGKSLKLRTNPGRPTSASPTASILFRVKACQTWTARRDIEE